MKRKEPPDRQFGSVRLVAVGRSFLTVTLPSVLVLSLGHFATLGPFLTLQPPCDSLVSWVPVCVLSLSFCFVRLQMKCVNRTKQKRKRTTQPGIGGSCLVLFRFRFFFLFVHFTLPFYSIVNEQRRKRNRKKKHKTQHQTPGRDTTVDDS